METCLPLVMRISRRELREMLLFKEGSLCHSLTQHQRWTWPQKLPSPLSLSTPPPSQPPTSQRPTTSHARRSMPKKLGQERSPPRHYSSNQSRKAADSQVTSRYIRDCDLAEVELSTSQTKTIFFYIVVSFCCHFKKVFLVVSHKVSSTVHQSIHLLQNKTSCSQMKLKQ